MTPEFNLVDARHPISVEVVEVVKRSTQFDRESA